MLGCSSLILLECHEVEQLEIPPEGPVATVRSFFLMTRAAFQPKYSTFIVHEYSSENEKSPCAPELHFPFYVSLGWSHSKVCPEIKIPMVKDSDHVSLELAGRSSEETSSKFLMHTEHPYRPHLKDLRVTGLTRLPNWKKPATRQVIDGFKDIQSLGAANQSDSSNREAFAAHSVERLYRTFFNLIARNQNVQSITKPNNTCS